MSDVTLSKAVRSNLLHLQNTAKMMDATQERLATGKKVNSALDNPTNFFTAGALNARAADIGTLLDAMSNGIRTIEAADNGLKAITKTLESMQSTLRQARQDKSFQVQSFQLSPTATGEISFEGGALEDSVGIGLTNAVPASITAGANYALEGSQGAASFNFTGADFDHADDTISFNLTIDGVTQMVVINKTIANNVAPPDGDLNTPVLMQNALQAAITAAGFAASSFELGENAGTITIASTSRGPDSEVAISGATINNGVGAGTDLVLADTGLNAPVDATVAAPPSTFTIGYGASSINVTLNGDDHPTPQAAVDHIAAEIATFNSDPLNAGNEINVTVSHTGGRLVLRGPADGTGPAISVTGAGADAVFGTPGQRETIAPSLADGPAKTVDQLVYEINNHEDLKGRIRASNDNGRLRIENLSTGTLDINGVTAGTITGGTTDTDVAEIGGNNIRANLAKQFNEMRTQLDRLAEDASFNGINLLRGDNLKIVFNELGTSHIEIMARGSDGQERPINSVTLNLRELAPEDLDFDADIDQLLHNLQLSLGEVRSQASDLGSTLSIVQNRENFTKEMINTLQTGAANLTLADTNEEAANMLALQTRQQLSQTALSLASQADQAVLRLFG